jgi:hypothetical protein
MQIMHDYGSISFFYLTKTGTIHTISNLSNIIRTATTSRESRERELFSDIPTSLSLIIDL